MSQIKTSELTCYALDWAVWTAAGGAAAYPKTASGKAFLKLWNTNSSKYVHPSSDWEHGGPIIQREGIELLCNLTEKEAANFIKGTHADWRAGVRPIHRNVSSYGPTPLIAVCRCYVQLKLGDTVDIPEELCT